VARLLARASATGTLQISDASRSVCGITTTETFNMEPTIGDSEPFGANSTTTTENFQDSCSIKIIKNNNACSV